MVGRYKLCHCKIFKKNVGFTLVEVLIVIVIISIITAIAIPSYNHYTITTKIGSMFQEADAAKLAVIRDYYKLNITNISQFPTYAADSTDFTTKNSDYISSISVTTNGVITVQGESTKFADKNIWIKWTPTIVGNDLSWQCSYSSDANTYVISSDYCL